MWKQSVKKPVETNETPVCVKISETKEDGWEGDYEDREEPYFSHGV